jgi:hypothetical protein
MAPRPEALTRERLEAARPEVIKAIITKAGRYAIYPQEGYAAGCYLRRRLRWRLSEGRRSHHGRQDEAMNWHGFMASRSRKCRWPTISGT